MATAASETRPFQQPERQGHDGLSSLSAQTHRSSASRLLSGLDDERIAKALGWFSVGLGVTEILAPRLLGKAVGVSDSRWIIRLCGVRELASGIGILTQKQPTPWLWSRVGGDAIDLMLLGAAARSPDCNPRRLALAGAAVAGVSALDLLCGRQMSSGAQGRGGVLRVSKSIGIERSPEELYRFWRNFANLPSFMSHLKSVNVIDDRRSHWVAEGPGGVSVEWDSEVVNDRPNEWIAWRSVEGADVDNAGLVRFEPAPNGAGSILKIDMRYNPPAGTVGATVAKLFGKAPEQQIQSELRRFKQLIETGEIATTEGQPSGKRSVIGKLISRYEPGTTH